MPFQMHKSLTTSIKCLNVLYTIEKFYILFQIIYPADLRLANLRTTVLFVTVHLEIFHCTHYQVIPESDLKFAFCSTINASYV